MKVKELKERREKLYISLSRDLAEFEKNFLLVSTGLLAFTIAFIKDIVQLDKADYLPLLILSWLSIIIAIALMLYAFIQSSNSSDKLINQIRNFQRQHNLYDDDLILPENLEDSLRDENEEIFKSAKSSLKCIRNWAIVFLIAGLTALGAFTSINILRNKKEKEVIHDTIRKGTLKINSLKLIINDSLTIDSVLKK